MDAADVAEAERIGLRLVVDLRDPHERDHDVDVAIPGCANVSVMLYEGTLIRFTPENYPELPDLYEALLTRHIGQVVTALDRIAAVLPDPVLVHCSAGKDRTGIIVALLQSIAGVPLTTILEDYSASEQLLGDAFTERLGQLLDRAGLHRGVLGPEPTASPGHYLGEALSVVTDQHGSIEAFLLRNGLGETAIERIRTGLTVPTTERARPVRF